MGCSLIVASAPGISHSHAFQTIKFQSYTNLLSMKLTKKNKKEDPLTQFSVSNVLIVDLPIQNIQHFNRLYCDSTFTDEGNLPYSTLHAKHHLCYDKKTPPSLPLVSVMTVFSITLT